jgi:hypothetical protein
VLTHFPSAGPGWLLARRDEAAREFAGAIHLARPGATFEIGQYRRLPRRTCGQAH